jgi:hypothetical protein
VAAVHRDDDVVKRSFKAAEGGSFEFGSNADFARKRLIHHRYRRRVTLSILQASHICMRARATHFAPRRTVLDVATGNIRKRLRVWLLNAQDARANDTEIRDEQISVCWRSRPSVGGDRNAGTRRGTRDGHETMVSAGRPPPAARRRYSRIILTVPTEPRSGRRLRRPQDQQRLSRLLIAVN